MPDLDVRAGKVLALNSIREVAFGLHVLEMSDDEFALLCRDTRRFAAEKCAEHNRTARRLSADRRKRLASAGKTGPAVHPWFSGPVPTPVSGTGTSSDRPTTSLSSAIRSPPDGRPELGLQQRQQKARHPGPPLSSADRPKRR